MGTWRGSPGTCDGRSRTPRPRQHLGVLQGLWGAGRPRCLLTPRGGLVSPRETIPMGPEGWDGCYHPPRAPRDGVGDGEQGRPPPLAPRVPSVHARHGAAPREGRASASPAAPPNFIAAINNRGGVARPGPCRSPSPRDRSTRQRRQGGPVTSVGRGKGTLFPRRPLTLRGSSTGRGGPQSRWGFCQWGHALEV